MTTIDSTPDTRQITFTEIDSWVDVIADQELPAELGVPALVGSAPVAVFRTHDGTVHAVSNLDPKTGASVMARGIVGSRGDVPTVASPLYKHVFDLRTGRCLDDESLALARFESRIQDGVIQVRAAG
jgi:nitrite reductase (NADH) small subunit